MGGARASRRGWSCRPSARRPAGTRSALDVVHDACPSRGLTATPTGRAHAATRRRRRGRAGTASGTCRARPQPGSAPDRTRQRHPDSLRLLLAGGNDPDLSRRVDRAQRQGHPFGRRLRCSSHAGDRALVIQRRVLRKQRRDVPVRSHAQDDEVERGNRPVVLGSRRGGEHGRVRLGGVLGTITGRAAEGRHRMDTTRVEGHRVQQGGPGLRLVALWITAGQEPLVTPPDVEPRPVDGVPQPRPGDRLERRVHDRAAGDHHRGRAAGGLRVDDPGHEAGGDRLRHGAFVDVHHDSRAGHAETLSARSP